MGNLGFGWEEVGVNVGKDTSVSNGGVAHEFVKFFVVSDGEEDVSGDDSGLFVIFGGVSGKFQNFSGQICKNKMDNYRIIFILIKISKAKLESFDSLK